jgi:hypothetical protein
VSRPSVMPSAEVEVFAVPPYISGDGISLDCHDRMRHGEASDRDAPLQ